MVHKTGLVGLLLTFPPKSSGKMVMLLLIVISTCWDYEEFGWVISIDCSRLIGCYAMFISICYSRDVSMVTMW